MMQSEKKPLIPLNVLVVEDSENDTLLLLRELRKGGYDPLYLRVQNADELKKALARQNWDVVLSDFSMPDFDGISALNIVRQSGRDIPFILVSGTITEENAVYSLKAGAQDFLTKHNLARLIPAINRELKEVEIRAERRRMQKELEEYHSGLEKKVEERTSELRAAHDLLQQSKALSDALNTIGEMLHSTLDLDKIMQRVIVEAARATGADAASIGLLQEGEVLLRYVHNLPQEFRNAMLSLDKVKGMGYAITARDAVAFNNAQNDDRVKVSFWQEHGVKSLMSVPLISRNEPIGALTLYSMEKHLIFGDIHLDFARKLSVHVSLAIDNSRLYRNALEARERASFFQNAIETSSQAFAAGYIDGTLILYNRAFLDLTGYSPEELSSKTWSVDLTPPEWRENEKTALRKLHVTGEPQLYEKEYVRKDGGRVPIEVNVHLVRDEHGNRLYYYGFISDITERKNAELALRQSEERFREAFTLAPIGIMLTDANGRYQYANRAFTELVGYREEEMQAPDFDLKKLSHSDDFEITADGLKKLLSGEIPVFFQEKRYIRKDGSIVWIAFSASVRRNEDGTPFQIVGLFQNINDRKKLEDEIRHMAHHDTLTGLSNRRLFTDIMQVELAQARRHKSKLALLFLDLDRFKNINDTLGHEIGDELLKEVADRLRKTVRESDTVSRIGGDEFNIVMSDIFRTGDISEFAQKIIDAVRKPAVIQGHELNITTSIGISVYPDDSSNIDVLRRYADIAMYYAKESGKNTYAFYNTSINVRSIERMTVENELRRSIEKGELTVYYQPQIDIRSNRIVCAEALVRWNHPERGLLEPNEFLPIAEEAGLLPSIGEWVLRTVTSQVADWTGSGMKGMCVTVNLSGREFQSPELIGTIDGLMREAGLPADCLDLEVTESTAMSNIELSASQMRKLQEMGVHISIDDFGTGYSSLNYLKRLPIQRLKIDKSFIQDISQDQDDRTIISAVTSMAHSMNMKVLAEGVETDAQLAFLRTVNCDEAQGFLFSKAVPAEELREMVAADRHEF